MKQKNEDAEPRASTAAIAGGEALKQLIGSIYRPRYAEILLGRPAIFHGLKKLVESVKVREFERVFLKDNFDSSVSFIAAELRDNG